MFFDDPVLEILRDDPGLGGTQNLTSRGAPPMVTAEVNEHLVVPLQFVLGRQFLKENVYAT